MDIMPINKGIVMLTSSCNLNCEYCFENHEAKNMTLDTAKQVMAYLQSNCQDGSSVRFVFFGGEPMLMFDKIIVPIIDYGKTMPHPVLYSMTTNGTLLTKDKIDFLQSNDVRVMFSFDGLKDVQDITRPMKCGKNSYDAVIKNLALIQESTIHYSVRGTLLKSWINRLFETIIFMSSVGVKNYHLLPNVWEHWDAEDIEELRKQLVLYEDYILDSFRSGVQPLLFSDYSAGFWRIMAIQNNRKRRAVLPCLPEARCGMGVRGSCSIDPVGDMYGCHHISPLTRSSDWYIGNVWDGLDKDRVHSLIAKYDKDKIGNSGCKNCPIDTVCDGGCTSTNLMVAGDTNIVPETFCIWRRSITDSAYHVAQILGNEHNELFRRYFIGWC